jgi:hypothetical protein
VALSERELQENARTPAVLDGSAVGLGPAGDGADLGDLRASSQAPGRPVASQVATRLLLAATSSWARVLPGLHPGYLAETAGDTGGGQTLEGYGDGQFRIRFVACLGRDLRGLAEGRRGFRIKRSRWGRRGDGAR